MVIADLEMLSRSVVRLFSTVAPKKVAVMYPLLFVMRSSLSGCGVYDGSEIHESVFILESLSRRNANYQCFAPNIDQMHVVNHLTVMDLEDNLTTRETLPRRNVMF